MEFLKSIDRCAKLHNKIYLFIINFIFALCWFRWSVDTPMCLIMWAQPTAHSHIWVRIYQPALYYYAWRYWFFWCCSWQQWQVGACCITWLLYSAVLYRIVIGTQLYGCSRGLFCLSGIEEQECSQKCVNFFGKRLYFIKLWLLIKFRPWNRKGNLEFSNGNVQSLQDRKHSEYQSEILVMCWSAYSASKSCLWWYFRWNQWTKYPTFKSRDRLLSAFAERDQETDRHTSINIFCVHIWFFPVRLFRFFIIKN
jgi:hypothetical protein